MPAPGAGWWSYRWCWLKLVELSWCWCGTALVWVLELELEWRELVLGTVWQPHTAGNAAGHGGKTGACSMCCCGRFSCWPLHHPASLRTLLRSADP